MVGWLLNIPATGNVYFRDVAATLRQKFETKFSISQYTDTRPIRCSPDPLMPGSLQGNCDRTIIEVTGRTRQGKARLDPRDHRPGPVCTTR